MYCAKIFKEAMPEMELSQFLNENHIDPKDIVSISMSCDSRGPERLGSFAVNQILLVYIKR